MDEKVLNLYIERLNNSAELYKIHKNEKWKQILLDDIDMLTYLHMNDAIAKIQSDFYDELPNEFKCVHKDGGTVYRVKRLEDGNYHISWKNSKIGEVIYSYEDVWNFIKDGTWKIVEVIG